MKRIYLFFCLWAALLMTPSASFILVLGFNLFGDGLRDILDPSLR